MGKQSNTGKGSNRGSKKPWTGDKQRNSRDQADFERWRKRDAAARKRKETDKATKEQAATLSRVVGGAMAFADLQRCCMSECLSIVTSTQTVEV